MKNVKGTAIKWKNESLEHAYKTAVKAGYTILVSYWEPKKTQSYFSYSDGINIAYVQAGDYGHGITRSTIHKGNRFCGTGYGLDMWDEVIEEVTAEELKEGFIKYPNWADQPSRDNTVKYKDLEEFLNAQHHPKHQFKVQ